MKKLAFIDPFVVSPAIHCFNEMVSLLGPMSYHMPSKFGTKGLEEDAEKVWGYLVVGSASHVTEPLEWHAPLAQFLLRELERGRPVLGCCFGHQLICHALGSEVDFAREDREKFTGSRSIRLTKDFWGFRQGEELTLPVTHRQVVKRLGPGLLSVGEGLANDIVVHEKLPLLTTQAHPEASVYFCESDIKVMDPRELELSRRDGQRFIQRFFGRFLDASTRP